MTTAPPHRLRDIPQIAELERLAILDRAWCEDEPDTAKRKAIDHISRETFGITEFDVWPDDPDDPLWTDFFAYQDDRLVFGPLGWDITDEYGRPMLILEHFSHQLFAAIRGLGGRLPDPVVAVAVSTTDWGKSLQVEAQLFRQAR